MSHIEQAWRRASGLAGVVQGAPESSAPQPASGTSLQQYPREGRPVRSSPNFSAREPVPAFVPRPQERPAARSVGAPAEAVRVGERPPTPALAQYRRLARSLQRMQDERGLHRLLVTSALAGDGRTSTATNAAVALSDRFDRRVLLIDADVQRPSIHDVFRLTVKHGLSDVLLGRCHNLPLVQVSAKLSVLPGGRMDPNAMAALTSDRME